MKIVEAVMVFIKPMHFSALDIQKQTSELGSTNSELFKLTQGISFFTNKIILT